MVQKSFSGEFPSTPHLHDIGRVRAVVVSVGFVIVRLDDDQPRSERCLVTFEGAEDVEAAEELKTKEKQRTIVGQFLEAENVEVPIECAAEQLVNLRCCVELRA